jgi:diphthamide biosynthesis protein 2
VFVSDIYLKSSQFKSTSVTSNDTKLLYSRTLPADVASNNSTQAFLYIGRSESFLTPFLFYFNKSKFFIHKANCSSSIERVLFDKTNRELMRRYYLIEKARDAKIFGILVGTMSVSEYNEAIDHVRGILKSANRRYYMFLIGKLNCAKLNNFMEVDMYVMVACNENSLINSKELLKPIITVYELEIAFNKSRSWGDEFICDYRQLLRSGGEHYLLLSIDDQESDVSLITGELRLTSKKSDQERLSEGSLVKRDEALVVMHYNGAG